MCLAAAAAAGLALSLATPGRGLVAAAADEAPAAAAASLGDLPEGYGEALAEAWQSVDSLGEQVLSKGILPKFGKLADDVVGKAVKTAGAAGDDAHGLAQVLDAPLRALYQQQLQTLMGRCADVYEAELEKRPNPLEASWAASDLFVKSASDLVRPGSGWSFEAEHQDLLARLKSAYSRDMIVVQDQAKKGQGKQVTIEVIRKLQQQAAAVQREAETRGAFPWNVKWQYMVENTPVGFRGQYNQGRSVVELLLMPSMDPRQKNNILNKIGPLNLAVAFDMLL